MLVEEFGWMGKPGMRSPRAIVVILLKPDQEVAHVLNLFDIGSDAPMTETPVHEGDSSPVLLLEHRYHALKEHHGLVSFMLEGRPCIDMPLVIREQLSGQAVQQAGPMGALVNLPLRTSALALLRP